MKVRLLGTGTSDGWPNPWCACASCAAAAAAGVVRGQTSALLDDRLLLDMGQDAPRAAVRQGSTLAGVEAVLLTHDHPDHHNPEAWQWRGWAPTRGPLTLVAPPAVLATAQPRLDSAVTSHAIRAGERVSVAGFDVLALPALHGPDALGPAVLYDVTGPDGARLLWGTDTGVLPEAALTLATDRAYDLVLLELSSSPIPTHLDLTTWPLQVARLRRVGAVTAATQLVAIHLGHHNPSPAELDAALAAWGATAPPDGAVLQVGPGAAARPTVRPRRVLVLGGARSGKSAHAEHLLAAEPEVLYVATAPPRTDDASWSARIDAHVDRRPAHWQTVESGDVAGLLSGRTPMLIDDLGLWLTRVIDDAGAWDQVRSPVVDAAIDALVVAWQACRTTAVLVVPEVGSGVVPATASGRLFRDLLGLTTTRLARHADDVQQVVAGLPRTLR